MIGNCWEILGAVLYRWCFEVFGKVNSLKGSLELLQGVVGCWVYFGFESFGDVWRLWRRPKKQNNSKYTPAAPTSTSTNILFRRHKTLHIHYTHPKTFTNTKIFKHWTNLHHEKSIWLNIKKALMHKRRWKKGILHNLDFLYPVWTSLLENNLPYFT